MLQKHATDLAAKMGIELSEISFDEGTNTGFADMHLLHLNVAPNVESVPVRQQDIEDLLNGSDCTRLDLKLCAALSKLKNMPSGGTL